MSEKPTFEQETYEIEHKEALPASTHEKESTPTEASAEVSAVTTQEALKNADEASSETDSRKVLEGLDMAENKPQTTSPYQVSREQKAITTRRSLKKLREKESLRERTLSRVVHQPAVRVISEGAGKTISRPSGLLGGGLAAFLGSGSYLVLAETLHFKYNYSVSLAFFAGGFVFGLALELFVHAATASRRRAD